MTYSSPSSVVEFIMTKSGKDCDGFILVPVLCVLAVIALVAALLTRSTMSDVKATANLIHQAQGEVLSDGIARLTILYLAERSSSGDDAGGLQLDGTPFSCAVGSFVSTISVASTDGLISLNSASADVLEKLFGAAGAFDPKALAAAVIDFRDIDDILTPNGAEAKEYAAAGLNYRPKNAPFSNIDELDQVLGMTEDVLSRVRPMATPHGYLSSPDLAVAGPDIRSLGLTNTTAGVTRARVLRIQVSVGEQGRPRKYTRETTILREPRVLGGVMVKDWSRSDQPVGQSDASSANQLPACLSILTNAKT